MSKNTAEALAGRTTKWQSMHQLLTLQKEQLFTRVPKQSDDQRKWDQFSAAHTAIESQLATADFWEKELFNRLCRTGTSKSETEWKQIVQQQSEAFCAQLEKDALTMLDAYTEAPARKYASSPRHVSNNPSFTAAKQSLRKSIDSLGVDQEMPELSSGQKMHQLVKAFNPESYLLAIAHKHQINLPDTSITGSKQGIYR